MRTRWIPLLLAVLLAPRPAWAQSSSPYAPSTAPAAQQVPAASPPGSYAPVPSISPYGVFLPTLYARGPGERAITRTGATAVLGPPVPVETAAGPFNGYMT